LLHVYVASWIRTREDLLFIVAMLFVALLLEALFMVGAPFLGGGFGFLGGSGGVGTTGGQRLTGTFGSPNYAGSYLALALAPALGVLLSSAAPRYKQLAILAVAAGSVALLLTFSRGGWIAFGLAVGILCALTWQRGWMPLPFPLAAIALVLVAGLVSGDVVLARLVGTDAGSAESRVPLMRIAWRMIEDHKALGVGANNFTENIAQYTTPEFRNEWLYTVHNKYLLVWAETGTAGLAAFLLLLAGTLRRGWACWRLGDRLLSPVALGLTAATVGLISHMLVEVFSGRSLALFWLFAGLISAIDGMLAREASLLYPAPSSIPVQESSTTKISTTTD
jgi:O-antigen ligase